MQLSGTLSNYARNMPDLQIMPEFFSGIIRFAHYARFVISGIQLCHLAALKSKSKRLFVSKIGLERVRIFGFGSSSSLAFWTRSSSSLTRNGFLDSKFEFPALFYVIKVVFTP